MSRLWIALALLSLCGMATLAAVEKPLAKPAAITTTAVAAPLVCAPLQGVVTILAPCGQFYTNLGTKEMLSVGAVLSISREGRVIGKARVVKVGELDSIAEQSPRDGLTLLESGDCVEVLSNPTAKNGVCKTDNDPGFLLALLFPGCGPRLPDFEPNNSQRGKEAFLGLAFAAVVIQSLQ